MARSYERVERDPKKVAASAYHPHSGEPLLGLVDPLLGY
jgi:hypothetical protein